LDSPAPGSGVEAVRVDWARRKLMLLFRLSALFLLRLAERRFSGLLFQEPPRAGRLAARSPAKDDTREDAGAQTQGVGVQGVADPALERGLDSVQVDQSRCVGAGESMHALTKAVAIVIA
jgi:hypothetical protein